MRLRQAFRLFLLVVIFVLAIIFARNFGQRILPPPNYLHAEGCPLPCWNQLRPGVQNTNIFWFVLQDVRDEGGWMYSGSPSSIDGTTMSEFRLQIAPSPQIRLGDVLFVYGIPDSAQANRAATLAGNSGIQGGRQPIGEIALFWDDYNIKVIARAVQPGFFPIITPDMWVREIRMRDPEGELLSIDAGSNAPWRGFGNASFYDISSIP